MLAFVIIGIIQGAIIGLLAIGIVLVYKGSRVFNFAQGEFGTIAAFFLYYLNQSLGLPYFVSMLIAIIGVGLVGFILERLVVQPLFNAPRVTLLVATAGFSLLAIAMEIKIGGVRTFNLPRIVEGKAFDLFGATITWQALITLAVFGALALGLAYFFNRTDLGLAVLATSQEPVATELAGIGTKRMSAFIWVFAAVLGAIAGILLAPDTTFTAAFVTKDYLLLGFTAAVVGGVTSLAGAFIGGQLIGIVQQLANWFDSRFIPSHVIPSFANLIVFVMLVGILLIRPKGLLGAEA